MALWRNQRGNQKKPRDKWQWRYTGPKPMGFSKSNSQREFYSNTISPWEIRKSANNLNLQLKQLEKEEQTIPKVSRKKSWRSEQK